MKNTLISVLSDFGQTFVSFDWIVLLLSEALMYTRMHACTCTYMPRNVLLSQN